MMTFNRLKLNIIRLSNSPSYLTKLITSIPYANIIVRILRIEMIRMMSTIMKIRMILRMIGQRNLEMEIMTMDDSHEKILGMGIDELELSVRSYNCLTDTAHY